MAVTAQEKLEPSDIHATIRFAMRVPTDLPGTLELETSVIDSTGSHLKKLIRWGDCSRMAIDPADDCRLWYTTEYSQSDGTRNWSTQLGFFKIAGCR